MSLDYADEAAYEGSKKPQKSTSKRRVQVAISDAHPFDLDAYISQYTGGRFAHTRLSQTHLIVA